ncbi:MAG: response regulator, partial [candidate division Zixibacteria bacterium]|nr:response regulator [candidate division Zixibacteria bacterium]
MASKIRVFIAEDNILLRKGIVALLAEEDSIMVVGEGGDGDAAVEMVAALKPNLAMVGLNLPPTGGVSAAKRIRSRTPLTDVLILSPYKDESQLRDALEAGARSFLLRNCSYDELIHAIRHAARGDYYFSGPVGKDLVDEYIKPLTDENRTPGTMTEREREIAILLANGYSTKEAAEKLHISPKTAETHRASISRKLGAKNVTDIVKYCIRHKLIDS